MMATWLLEAAKWTGYPVVEVDGWQQRGHGQFTSLEGVVGHHTGTPDTAPGDYPSLRIVRDGRSDLAGPLCNYGLGRSGTIYVVAAGVAWHAGTSSFAGFTNLNDKFLGIEAESAGNGRWTAQQLDAYPKLVAAALHAMGKDASRYVSHRTCATPSGRKPDPTGIDDSWMRNQVATLLTNPGDSVSDFREGPWLGGITNIEANTPADQAKAEKYDDHMMIWRNNVEIHQTFKLLKRMADLYAGDRQDLLNAIGSLQSEIAALKARLP